MTLSMVSSVIQAVVGEELAGSTGYDLASQLAITLIRILILLATFLLANATFNKKKHHKPISPYNQGTRSLLYQSHIMKTSPKKPSGFKGKRIHHPPSEDEDALSTSVGSSDSESDLISSDREDDAKGMRISMSELLRRRPPVGPAPPSILKTMPAGPPVQQRRSCHAWENARGAQSAQQPQVRLGVPAKTTAKMATSKAALAAPKAFCKIPPAPLTNMIGMGGNGSAEAKPERIQALLSIICPEEESVAA